MAISSLKLKSTLVLQCKMGVDKNGKDITKNQKFNNLRVNATDENIYEIGGVLESLLAAPTIGVLKEDKTQIISK